MHNGKAAFNEKKWALKPIVTIKNGELFPIYTIQANLNYEIIFRKTKNSLPKLGELAITSLLVSIFFVEDTVYGSSFSKQDCVTTRSF